MKYILILCSCLMFVACSKEPQVNLVNKENVATAIKQIADINPANEYTYLWVEPDIGEEPLLYLINHAKKSVYIVMYELNDKKIQLALSNIANKKVSVKIIYSNQTRYIESIQKFCSENPQISCKCSSGPNGSEYIGNASYGFPDTHEKSLIIDNNQIVIMTGNMVNTKSINYFTEDRDFIVVTNNTKDVQTLLNAFATDWENAINQSALFPQVQAGSRLFFSPSNNISEAANSYNVISNLINTSKKSIDIYSEYFLDGRIAQLLNYKARSGVRVRIITAKKIVNGLDPLVLHIQMPKGYPLYFHAKSIIVDNKIATVMSVNYTYTSINKGREAGIILSDSKNVTKLEDVFNADWKKLQSSSR